jgi:hypothetical protein
MNMSGEPCHPLYLPRDSMLKQYQRNVYDPDSGLELKPETKKRLIESSKLPKETLVSSEEMRKLTLQNYGQKRGPKQS